MDEQRGLEKGLYLAGWCSIAAVMVAVLWAARRGWGLAQLFGACPLWLRAGIYCPGCGGRRALEAILGGRLLQSLYYHPLCLYVLLLFAAFMLSHTLYYLSRRRLPRLRYHNAYPLVAVGLLLFHFAFHNILLWIFNIPL